MIRLHWGSKDGGPESRVWCYGIECKRLGSVLLLRFEHGSREAYHSHAFHAVSWVLSGLLIERFLHAPLTLLNKWMAVHPSGWRPIVTRRETMHKVASIGRSWVLSLRGPWSASWQEHVVGVGTSTLTHGRVVKPWQH